jgi:hypothetical protein
MFSQAFVSPTSGGSGGAVSSGQVLGESCGIYLSEYIKYGKVNNPDEVKKLQIFLNKHLKLNLLVTGFYDSHTRDGVNTFQLAYSKEVLLPWVSHGLPNETTPTGYVYKTTKRWINLMECSALDLPMPKLP